MNCRIARLLGVLAALVVGAAAMVLLAFAVKFGREMGRYLETSVGLTSVGVAATTDSAAEPTDAPTAAAEPISDTTTDPPRNEDAAELRTQVANN